MSRAALPCTARAISRRCRWPAANCLRAYRRRRKHNDPIAGAALAPGAHGGAGRADGHGRPAAGETAPGQDRLAGGGGAPAFPRMPAAATPDGEG